MSVNPIDKLECQLESLIESAFARLFRRTMGARDIAVLLLRAIEDNAASPATARDKPIGPNLYHIQLNPENVRDFLAEFPDLAARLSRIIINLSEDSGYQLMAEPTVNLLANNRLTTLQAIITAEHSPATSGQTAKMQQVSTIERKSDTQYPLLHIDGGRVVPLAKSVINIGREKQNDIVIVDDYVSRHRLQLRKRFGVYTLYDINSRGGTRVNDNEVAEHRLLNGDVIAIGHTTLVYSDVNGLGVGDGTTQVLRSG